MPNITSTRRERYPHLVENVVIKDDSRGLVVEGNEGLVKSRRLVSGNILDLPPMSREVKKEGIPCLDTLHKPLQGSPDVGLGEEGRGSV